MSNPTKGVKVAEAAVIIAILGCTLGFIIGVIQPVRGWMQDVLKPWDFYLGLLGMLCLPWLLVLAIAGGWIYCKRSHDHP